jgi:phage terminase small subunit
MEKSQKTAENTPEINPLSPKREMFCQEYVGTFDSETKCFNATQAAIKAGYSKKTAQEQSSRLLSNAIVKARIDLLIAERLRRVGVTQDEVIAELKKIAFSNMRDFVNWGPNGVALQPSSELTEEQAACVSEVSETTTEGGGSLKFKLHDKKGALETLARHLGMLHDNMDHTTKDKEIAQHVYNFIDVKQKEQLESVHYGADGL